VHKLRRLLPNSNIQVDCVILYCAKLFSNSVVYCSELDLADSLISDGHRWYLPALNKKLQMQHVDVNSHAPRAIVIARLKNHLYCATIRVEYNQQISKRYLFKRL
jgi:hypothetical protein